MNPVAPFLAVLLTQSSPAAPDSLQLTIYNQNFAVVRQRLSTNLKAGINTLTHTDIPRTLEPDSVVLRDPTGKRELRVLEKSFRPSPLTPEALLSRYEGKVLDFELPQPNGQPRIITGKVLRGSTSTSSGGLTPPLIEIEGKTRFGLPGIPLFPPLSGEDPLKPTLSLLVEAGQSGPLELDLSYLTGTIGWEASYNLIAPEKGDTFHLTGLVTIKNFTGKTFDNARVQLMAGDINKTRFGGMMGGGMPPQLGGMPNIASPVPQRSFDDYHLYSLGRPTSLRDGETKQVEFIQAEKVTAQSIYVYNGSANEQNHFGSLAFQSIPSAREYGTRSNPKVWIVREFKNTAKNGLGVPLPKGRVRFYRKEGEALQFIGENTIDHTPEDALVQLYTGDAFDLVGARRQTTFNYHTTTNTTDEGFEIKLFNHKKEPVVIRIIEKLYRGTNWEVRTASEKFVKKDSDTIEYTVTIPPDGEKTVTYTAHYWW